ncbi:MAG: phosphate ABC transporter ATP-binding protein PstB [Carboxydocellales bacterium]
MEVKNLSAWYQNIKAVCDVNMHINAGKVTAIIGPSGCGKSTFIRCINRLHETIPGAKIQGEIFLENEPLLGFRSDVADVRRRVAMVFQKPNPFPTMSIFENIAIGLRINGIPNGKKIEEIVEEILIRTALWDEVKDRLNSASQNLSGGQQQRLCIARALALEPEVLLLDEPCSALDPISTMRIENLITQLKEHLTVVIVTHNMQQAARISDYTGFFLTGELVEFDKTEEVFSNPVDKRTEDYITGRFG